MTVGAKGGGGRGREGGDKRSGVWVLSYIYYIHEPHVVTATESGVWVCYRGTQTLHHCGLC